jgi:hypothetical protein
VEGECAGHDDEDKHHACRDSRAWVRSRCGRNSEDVFSIFEQDLRGVSE